MKSRNSLTVPKVTVDPNLDNLHKSKVVVEKLRRTNEFISKHGLPKEYYQSQGLTAPDSNA
ncbi:hypothetical protein SAMN04487996_101197 [Dyadobacter soli]|uniref:Uncharacterized protein n=1 Tax=Dyadobacter soli TaxID=659014 RepID=A0A1G6VB44_9BACT|nr:hypothetical protein [Dyadobacter soli]SDD50920.1 hypothetical protein SAMN04487996_101197 [Dyadobacter soli]